MKIKSVLLIPAAFVLLVATTLAQTDQSQAGAQAGQTTAQKPATQSGQPTAAEPPAEETPGKELGTYLVHQSIELGGRITDLTGSQGMYNTLVNIQDGPRVLEQSLSMQSRAHTGNVFDSLYASSFGWGGDPNNAARLRISKLGWYNFTGSFRRDKNYFDYDLLANPLNFPTATPFIPITVSPHAYFTTRRMYDFALTVAPQRRVSFRLGYSHNRSEGPSYMTFHENTEPLLDQRWNNTLNAFLFGVDVKLLPKTTVSFTENLQWSKIDTGYGLLPFNDWQLATSSTAPFVPSGVIASLGIPWQPSAGNPCSTPVVSLAAGLANPSCNLYLNYVRTQRVRNSIPTEQVNIASSSIRHLDVVARGAYSTADMTTPMTELFNGLVTRTVVRQWNQSDSVKGRWISVSADVGVTFHITDRLRLVDSFRFNNWRKPATLTEAFLYFYNAATVASPGNATLPIAMFPTQLLHNSSSNADVTKGSVFRFLKQDWKSNQIELQGDLARYAGVRIGYRFRHRTIADQEFAAATNTFLPLVASPACAGLPATSPCIVSTATSGDEAELESFNFPEHTGIFGLWVRPTDKMHFNFDTEITSSGDIITRVSPRHQEQYRGEFSYAPQSWVTFGINFNVLERRNHDPGRDINYDGHVENVGFNFLFAPMKRVGVEVAFNHTNYLQDTNLCFIGQNTGVPNTGCVFGGINATTLQPSLRETMGDFSNTTEFGTFAIRVKPVSRVNLSLGYAITENSGAITRFNNLQPFGSLQSRWQTPTASVGIGVTNELSLNAGWNYYQYSEGDVAGPTTPRYFHSNITTLSLKYAF